MGVIKSNSKTDLLNTLMIYRNPMQALMNYQKLIYSQRQHFDA